MALVSSESEELYYDPKQPGSLSGVDKFYRHQKDRTRGEVEDFLRGEASYSLHFPVKYRFDRNKVVVAQIDQLWDVDLLSLITHRTENSGYAYVLVAIDILSHFARVQKLKTKTGREVRDAFEQMLSKADSEGRRAGKIRSDNGGEFTNALLAKFFREKGIVHFTTNNESIKANYAERFIKTLHGRLSRAFTKTRSHRWVDILDDVVESYNHTHHRSIGMAPASVTKGRTEHLAWTRMYESSPGPAPDGRFKYDVGQTVRISKAAKVFRKELDERYTVELFRVASRFKRGGLNLYTLSDFNKEKIGGSFYQKELQGVTADPSGVYRIDRIIRQRKERDKSISYLVSWEGWASSFNSWVKKADLVE
jgi:transposase InsO family protein